MWNERERRLSPNYKAASVGLSKWMDLARVERCKAWMCKIGISERRVNGRKEGGLWCVYAPECICAVNVTRILNQVLGKLFLYFLEGEVHIWMDNIIRDVGFSVKIKKNCTYILKNKFELQLFCFHQISSNRNLNGFSLMIIVRIIVYTYIKMHLIIIKHEEYK